MNKSNFHKCTSFHKNALKIQDKQKSWMSFLNKKWESQNKRRKKIFKNKWINRLYRHNN